MRTENIGSIFGNFWGPIWLHTVLHMFKMQIWIISITVDSLSSAKISTTDFWAPTNSTRVAHKHTYSDKTLKKIPIVWPSCKIDSWSHKMFKTYGSIHCVHMVYTYFLRTHADILLLIIFRTIFFSSISLDSCILSSLQNYSGIDVNSINSFLFF